jgi:aminopeptidase N
VSWYVNGERREKELVMDKAWQQFAIENGEPVDLLMVDEAVDLLAVKRTNRGKAAFHQSVS